MQPLSWYKKKPSGIVPITLCRTRWSDVGKKKNRCRLDRLASQKKDTELKIDLLWFV